MQRNMNSSNYQILAIVTSDDENIKNGKATMFLCKDEQEKETIMREVALALKGDVVRLSNGTCLIVRS